MIENIDLTNELSDNFFSKFDPKEEVLLVINTFHLRDKVLLHKKYCKKSKGENHTTKLLKAYNIVKRYLINQNKKISNPRYYATIESILRDISLEELSKINIRTLNLMKIKYGEDYNTPNLLETLSKEENKYLTSAISVVKKRIKAKHI